MSTGAATRSYAPIVTLPARASISPCATIAPRTTAARMRRNRGRLVVGESRQIVCRPRRNGHGRHMPTVWRMGTVYPGRPGLSDATPCGETCQ